MKTREVYIIGDNIVSPLGISAGANFAGLKNARSGIRLHTNPLLSQEPVYASLLDHPVEEMQEAGHEALYTKFEKILIGSVKGALENCSALPLSDRTIMIMSSTKGNISLLEQEADHKDLRSRIALHSSARLIANHFQFRSRPVVVSHACISGLVALITGMRLLQAGRFDTAVITGGDLITRFVLSGFQSFQAVSKEPCRPFDAQRNGINLGEGAATVILSVHKPDSSAAICITGGSVSNDANHISGPSRSGEELSHSIKMALGEAGVEKGDIDFISAHGTATIYNDEMEARAIHHAGLADKPVNSLKGYYGHTLGAAGLIETVVAIHSLRENIFLPTLGFQTAGTSLPLHITKELMNGTFSKCLKTASGFGGCNAAIVLQKAG